MLKPPPIPSIHRAPLLLSTKQWAAVPVQRRFASGDTESFPSDQGKLEAQTLSESPQAAPSIESALPDETVATQAIPAEETTKVEPATIEATSSSLLTSRSPVESIPMHQDLLQDIAAAETAPINGTLASASASASAAGDSANRLTPNPVLYVGNLYFEVSEDALQEQFAPHGKISRVRIVYDHRGLSKGYVSHTTTSWLLPARTNFIAFRFGYVEFENVDDATAAIASLNQQLFRGRRMAVQYHRKRASDLSRPRQPNDPSKTLFIGNMSFEMSDKDLNDLFREVRNVVDVRVAIDRRTGQPRGFAHADFIDTDSAMKAKEFLQAKEVYGRRLRVDFSKSSARSPSQ
jgi:nucleolin